jgi:N-acetylmuramoyl-L-alanine amidase
VVVLVSLLRAQGTAPASPITIVTPDGRRQLPTTILNGQEFVGLDDVAATFQVAVREDTLAKGVLVTYKGRTIVASTDQPLASINGRVVTLPAPVARAGRRLLVPIDFIARALGPIYDAPIDFRRAARLMLVGNVRAPRVTARIESAGPPTMVVIDITPAFGVTSGFDAGRLSLRVDADVLDFAAAPAAAGLVDQVRLADPTTIGITLSQRAGTARISTTTAGEATRVTIEVPLAQAPDSSTGTPPSATPLPGGPGETPPIAIGRPRFQTMVIDPGHGGDDTGVHGAAGTLEKGIALDVARRLRSLVETRLGVRVVMTRDDDRSISPDERDAIANNNKADLFLSIHVNGAPASAVTGAEVYYLRLDREAEDVRRSAVATEQVLPAVGGGPRPVDVIQWDLAQALHVESSARLAAMLAEELQKHGPVGARPVQQEPMRVLSGANMPAALIEIGYLTNPNQEKQLKSADYQNNVAQALYDAVLRFRGVLEEGSAATP